MENYPAHTAEKRMIRDHMAQTLTLQARTPDIRSDCKRYNARGMSRSEWEKQQTQLVAAPENREMRNLLATDLEGGEGIRPAALYDKMNEGLREAFAERFARPRCNESENDSRTVLRKNKQRERIKEYAGIMKEEKYKECGEIQEEIARDDWRSFPSSAKVSDLKEVYLLFLAPGYRGQGPSQTPVPTPSP